MIQKLHYPVAHVIITFWVIVLLYYEVIWQVLLRKPVIGSSFMKFDF